MRTLLLTLGILWMAVPPSQSQDAPFRPLHLGDEWVYETEQAYNPSSQVCLSDYSFVSYTFAEVVAETTLDGEPAREVACTTVDALGTVLYTERVAAALEFNSPIEALGGPAQTCLSLFHYGSALSEQNEVKMVTLGTTEYEVPTRDLLLASSQGPGGSSYSLFAGFAEPFGQYSQFSTSVGHGAANPSCHQTRRRLVYAEIDGVAYGERPPVTVDSEPQAPARTDLVASPSPARSAVSIEAEPGTPVVVVDALGRRVDEGTTDAAGWLRLDVSTWAPGVYLVRAGRDGHRSTTRFVIAR